MGILATIKAYAAAIIAIVAIVGMGALAFYIYAIKAERDSARATVQAQQVTINGYIAASKAAHDALEKEIADAKVAGEEARAIILKLQESLPKNDDEARVWALKAAGVIR